MVPHSLGAACAICEWADAGDGLGLVCHDAAACMGHKRFFRDVISLDFHCYDPEGDDVMLPGSARGAGHDEIL